MPLLSLTRIQTKISSPLKTSRCAVGYLATSPLAHAIHATSALFFTSCQTRSRRRTDARAAMVWFLLFYLLHANAALCHAAVVRLKYDEPISHRRMWVPGRQSHLLPLWPLWSLLARHHLPHERITVIDTILLVPFLSCGRQRLPELWSLLTKVSLCEPRSTGERTQVWRRHTVPDTSSPCLWPCLESSNKKPRQATASLQPPHDFDRARNLDGRFSPGACPKHPRKLPISIPGSSGRRL